MSQLLHIDVADPQCATRLLAARICIAGEIDEQQRTKIGGKNCGYHRRKQRDWLGHSQALRGRRCARSDRWAPRERAEGGRSLSRKKRYDGRRRRVAVGRSGSALCRRERETWSHRHTLRERGRGNNRNARGGYRETFRPDL